MAPYYPNAKNFKPNNKIMKTKSKTLKTWTKPELKTLSISRDTKQNGEPLNPPGAGQQS